LAEVGFVEGKNFAFEYRWAQGHFERLPGLAIDLVGRGPAVIATNTLPAALAAPVPRSTLLMKCRQRDGRCPQVRASMACWLAGSWFRPAAIMPGRDEHSSIRAGLTELRPEGGPRRRLSMI
jgi:hypothetical protein